MTKYGFWDSPLSADDVVTAGDTVDLSSGVRVGGGRVIWAESRPREGGRVTLLEEGTTSPIEILPTGYSARSAVHEYGGAAFSIVGEDVYFVNWDDQRIYRLTNDEPQPVTPEPPSPRAWRYSAISGTDSVLIAVRERHESDEVINEVIRIADDEITVVAEGADFYSDPQQSPSGERLVWVEWDHPNMPWDDTRIVIAGPDANQTVVTSGSAAQQPRWEDDDTLVFVDDRTGYWNLYRRDLTSGRDVPLFVTDDDMGVPPWLLGLSSYALLDSESIAAVRYTDGVAELGLISDHQFSEMAPELNFVMSVVPDGEGVVFVGGSATSDRAVYRWEVANGPSQISTPADTPLTEEHISRAGHRSFPSKDGRTTYANVYLPKDPDESAPADNLPPLVIMIHGGPTGNAAPFLRPDIQYWTTRGFAVADVNYGGSAGYGKEYRELLRDTWGIVDVEDCIAVARGLAEAGDVDPRGLFIRGGSAGGFTTLAVLSQSDIFAAGGNLFGVSDLAALTTDTHKFESRYLDGLVGPYPEATEIYTERSPINHLDDFNTPLIVFQGADDKIVPPDQSREIVVALEEKGVPVEYHEFEGEAHGFRKAENLRTVLETELAFYQNQLGSRG